MRSGVGSTPGIMIRVVVVLFIASGWATPANAQGTAASVVVTATPSAPRCGEAGVVAVAFDVRLEGAVSGVGGEGDALRVATLCVSTPTASPVRGRHRPRGYAGIWPGDRVCLLFEPISQLPAHDLLVQDGATAPSFYVVRATDARCE